MQPINKQLLILIGHYGTGKTTLALNISNKWAKKHHAQVTIADLDVNNPYFRTRDWLQDLEEKGIKVVMPEKTVAYAEAPYLPKEIYSVLKEESRKVIIDVGGHDVGTTVLGSISDHIKKVPHEVWMVINTYRPEMETEEEIIYFSKRLEKISKLRITGFVNNTNLTNRTEIEDLIQSEEMVVKVANKMNIPFVGTTVEESLLVNAEKCLNNTIIPINRYDLFQK